MHNDETVISDVPDMINKAPIIPGHSPSLAVAGMSGSEHNNTTITTTTVTTDIVTTTTPTTTESVPRPGPVGHGTEYGVQVAGRVTGSGIHDDQMGNVPVTGISSDQAGASGISSSSSPSQQQHQQKKQQENEHGLNSPINASNSLKTSSSTEEQADTLKSSPVSNTGTDKSELPFLFSSSPVNTLMGTAHVVLFSFVRSGF